VNTNLLAAGDPLDEAQGEAERGLAFARQMRFGLAIDSIAAQLQLIRTLRGLTPNFGFFDDEQFDELRMERRFSSNSNLALAEGRYWIRKLQARFFAGDYAGAVNASERAQRLLWALPSMFETAEYHFYGALSKAASYDSVEPGQRHSMSRLSLHTTDNSRSGRRIAQRISKPAPRWWTRRSPASKVEILRRCAFTSRPSTLLATMGLSTTRQSPTSALPPFITPGGSTSSLTLICATLGSATCIGAPLPK
jgi:hypothetical protein